MSLIDMNRTEKLIETKDSKICFLKSCTNLIPRRNLYFFMYVSAILEAVITFNLT